MGGRPYSAEEIALIRARYPTEGGRLAAELGRPLSSLSKKAWSLGVYREGYENHYRPRRVWTEAEDQRIRALWPRITHREVKLKDIAGEFPGASIGQIRERAAHLGLVRQSAPPAPWTPEEDEYLCEWAHLGLCALGKRFKQRGWKRTRSALGTRLSQLGQKTRGVNDAAYSARGFAELMGVANANTISQWIKKGWLKAHPRTDATHRNGESPKEWFITPKDARKFVLDHVAVLDFAKADRFWLVDLLAWERPH